MKRRGGSETQKGGREERGGLVWALPMFVLVEGMKSLGLDLVATGWTIWAVMSWVGKEVSSVWALVGLQPIQATRERKKNIDTPCNDVS